MDADGNRISFGVDTSYPKRPTQHSHGSPINDEKSRAEAKTDLSQNQIETLRITKALTAEAESKNVVQIHTLPGPENVHLRDSVRMRWYHIPEAWLDFNRFRNVCLSVPGLSDRMQTLVREMLKKIEEQKLKAFLGGLFVEPGTVLRADERNQPDSQSVIFSCVPYLDLRPPAAKLSTSAGDRLFPPRTLMQSYYPYEPVRDRDKEQAYAIFNNDHSGNLINVPDLWVMNIGSDVVVTCGHQPLANNLIKSIEVVQENLEQLGSKSVPDNSLTHFRLTDWEGRVLLYPLNTCRTFFQLEQKVRELKYTAGGSLRNRTLDLVQVNPDGVKKVEPAHWNEVVGRTDRVFIDLAFTDNKEKKEAKKDLTTGEISAMIKSLAPSLVPPFFSWPARTPADTAYRGRMQGFIPTHNHSPMSCLEHAEKGMMSVTLDSYDTVNSVDKTFTSTSFYQSLPEDTYQNIRTRFPSLKPVSSHKTGAGAGLRHHEFVVQTQCTSIAERTMAFFETVHASLQLFVTDVDKSSMLRKVWGAMALLYNMVAAIEARGAVEYDSDEYFDPLWKPSATGKREWFIRNDAKNPYIPLPEADEKFKKIIKRCRRCQSQEPFQTPDAAFAHLQGHVKPAPQPAPQAGEDDTAPSSTTLPATTKQTPDLTPQPDLREWVINHAQASREQSNAGALAILVQGCTTAKKLFLLVKELAEGVQDEDGKLADIYRLPHHLVDAFREIIVFYLAIERALFYTEKAYQKEDIVGIQFDHYTSPYSEAGLDVLKRFGEGARRSLSLARAELCNMAASRVPMDIFHHLSLGPEYVCAWLMRRLLVQPLDERMTAGDMYRAYLSTMVRESQGSTKQC